VPAGPDGCARASPGSLVAPSWGEHASFVVECQGEGGVEFRPVAASGHCAWFPETAYSVDYGHVPAGGGVPWPTVAEAEKEGARLDWQYSSAACMVVPALRHAGALMLGLTVCSAAALARYLTTADALDLCSPVQLLEIGATLALLLQAAASTLDWRRQTLQASIAAYLAAALLVAALSLSASLASWVTDAALHAPRAFLLRRQVVIAMAGRGRVVCCGERRRLGKAGGTKAGGTL